MSTQKLDRLLCLLSDPIKRKQVIDFDLISICFSDQVKDTIKNKEEIFYELLSKVRFNDDRSATIQFNEIKLFMYCIEIEEKAQSENNIIIQVSSLDEELKRRKSVIQNIAHFLESGTIEIE